MEALTYREEFVTRNEEEELLSEQGPDSPFTLLKRRH